MCGYQISDTVNLKIPKEQIELVEDVKFLLEDELQEIIQNGGLIDTQGLREKLFERVREKKEISKERYIAEALFSMYDWKKIGIEEFSKEDRELVIQKIQEAGYKEELPEMTYSEFIEFLGLNKIEGTNLEDIWYQRQAINRTKELYDDGKKFSATVLPTASGKTGVPVGLMPEFMDFINQGNTEYGNGKMLYLAPDNEILNQTKKFIIEHVLPKEMTIGKKRDKVLKEAGIEFKTYSSLLNEKNRNGKYKFVVIDEAHRGGNEWSNALDELIENQDEDTYFLSLTATPDDRDGRDKVQDLCLRHKDRFGYTEEEIKEKEYEAINLNLIDGIKLGILENFIIAEVTTNTMKEAVSAKTDEKRKEAIDEWERQRRDLSKAEGLGEFLTGQLKEGDKVIVFMPVNYEIGENEEQEIDEDNKSIAEQKLKAFEEQEKEWLKGLGVEQHYYSMLGCYGDRKNQKQLESFEEQDDGISLMTVINKGTLGLHIEGVNKIIIARPLDESSTALLQQMIGRAMRRADSKNPLPKEEWPVIIDLCGNMKILEELIREIKEVKRRDDLRILEDIVDWIQDNNGGMYPNAEGKTSQERKMAIQLYRIYDQYLKYIDEEEIEEKKEERKEYIRKILTVGEEIDLWEKELEPIKEEIKKKEEINPFEVEGTLREFIEIETEVEEIYARSAVSKLIGIIEILKDKGIDPSKLPHTTKLLKDLKIEDKNGQEIDIERIIEETGVDGNYDIGRKIQSALEAAKGRGSYKITEEETEKLIEYGLITKEEIDNAKRGIEKESAVSELLRIIEILKNNGISPSQLPHTSKVLKDIDIKDKNGQEIDIERIIEETGLDGNYNIGRKIGSALEAAKGRGGYKITEEETEKLIEYGLITKEEIDKVKNRIKKESVVSKLIKIIDTLKEKGIAPSQLPHKNKLLKDLKIKDKNGQEIDIERIIEETGLDGNYDIGSKIGRALSATKGKVTIKITPAETEKLIEYGLITKEKIDNAKRGTEKESAVSELLRIIEILKNNGIDPSQLPHKNKLLKDLKIKDKNGQEINIERIIEETGLDGNYNIGRKIQSALQTAKGRENYKITEEETEKLIEYGLITKEEIDNVKNRIKKESAVSKLIKIIDTLKEKGIAPSQLPHKNKLLKDLKIKDKNGQEIDIERIIEETGLDGNCNIGGKIQGALQAAKGRGNYKIIEEETEKLIEYGWITREEINKSINVQQICMTTSTSNTAECDKAQNVLNQAITKEKEKGGVTPNDT